MSEIFALDIETRTIDSTIAAYGALQPFRVRQGKSEISSIAVCKPDDSVIQIINDGSKEFWVQRVKSLLSELKGQRVFAHNALFDVSWLIATIGPNKFKFIPNEIKDIQWADSILLGKWLINGQLAIDSKFSYSLGNMVKTFLPDHPKTKEFLEMKGQDVLAGEDEDYWQSRGTSDALMTKALADRLMEKVPKSMRVGLMTEWACIVPMANSWINGIKVDVNKIEEVEKDIQTKMDLCTTALGVDGSVISSPKQLGNLLFDQWGLAPWSYTATGLASTKEDDLLYLQYDLKAKDSDMSIRLDKVMEYKTNKTLMSKYINGLKEALDHNGDGYIYCSPKIFGTYTGRMTYSNSTMKRKYKTSIAMHQLPRKAKAIRSLLIAPDGYGLIEKDASGQESRLIAIQSNDPVMLEIFNQGLNFHSMTGASIIGMDYNEFMKRYNEGDKYIIEQRQLGKLDNLSCNYRIGGKALAKKAFTEYDTFMTEETGRYLVNSFARLYSKVPEYWSNSISFAKQNGYAETLGGRRFKISKWDNKNRWGSESSAINTPIQGSGADMKEIGISMLAKHVPEALMCLDLHDGLFFYTEFDKIKETSEKMDRILNEIDYSWFWGVQLPITLPYEGMYGKTFEDVK